MTLKARYEDRLSSIPAPGGNGCHPSLLSVANTGILADLPPSIIFEDIRKGIPRGGRKVTDREILAAINRAMADRRRGSLQASTPSPKPVIKNGRGTLLQIMSQAEIHEEIDLIEASPIRLLNSIETDPITLLNAVFAPDDLIFIGDRHEPGILGQTVRRQCEWIEYFEAGGKTAPFIIINPLTGKSAPKKGGDGETFRGDGCIAAFRHCLVEFDGLAHEDQIRFFSAVKLPIKALIHSGNKSIHGWIDIQKLTQVNTADDWQRHIKQRLYDAILRRLGVDSACSNPARLAWLPGHKRLGKGTQRLLYLSHEGKAINAE
jgi:hypothetical protein